MWKILRTADRKKTYRCLEADFTHTTVLSVCSWLTSVMVRPRVQRTTHRGGGKNACTLCTPAAVYSVRLQRCEVRPQDEQVGTTVYNNTVISSVTEGRNNLTVAYSNVSVVCEPCDPVGHKPLLLHRERAQNSRVTSPTEEERNLGPYRAALRTPSGAIRNPIEVQHLRHRDLCTGCV